MGSGCMNKEDAIKKCAELHLIYKDLTNALYVNDLTTVQVQSSKLKEFLTTLPTVTTPPPQEKL